MSKIVIVYRDVIVGGCELLIEKLTKQFVLRGNEVFILYQNCEKEMKTRYINAGAKTLQLDRWDVNAITQFDTGDELSVLTFLISDYLKFYYITRKTKAVVYAVHFKGLAYKNPLKIKLAGPIIKEMQNNNNIICMDKMTNEYTISCYKDVKLSNNLIVPIPIEIVDVNDETFKNRSSIDKFNILSIARAEFPFKGYLIGLVDKYKDWYLDNNNVSLTIISYGKDIEKLKSAIDGLPSDIKSSITLVGKTNYEYLDKYFSDAKLYVGMGTTLLDASQRGIPSIVVVPYTQDLIASSFFYDDNTKLAQEDTTSNTIDTLITEAMNWTQDEYIEKEKLSRNAVVKDYSVEKCADTIMNQFNIVKYSKERYKIRRKLLAVRLS